MIDEFTEAWTNFQAAHSFLDLSHYFFFLRKWRMKMNCAQRSPLERSVSSGAGWKPGLWGQYYFLEGNQYIVHSWRCTHGFGSSPKWCCFLCSPCLSVCWGIMSDFSPCPVALRAPVSDLVCGGTVKESAPGNGLTAWGSCVQLDRHSYLHLVFAGLAQC